MLDEMMVRYCAPTLAGIKTGNLMNCTCADRESFLETVNNMAQRLASRGICVMPFTMSENRILIYIFRPEKLKADLSSEKVAGILRRCGYSVDNMRKCIERLQMRLCQSGEFPHEIGLFLGYPPEDVRVFIENHAKNYKFAGYWKVYGDVQAAKRTFEQYKKCSDICYKQWKEGKEIEELIKI